MTVNKNQPLTQNIFITAKNQKYVAIFICLLLLNILSKVSIQ